VQCCATHQFCLQPGRNVAGSGYSRIVILAGKGLSRAALPTRSLSGREAIFECLAKHQFCFRLGTYCGVLRYPIVVSLAGKGSCRFWLLTNCLSGWKRTLEAGATEPVLSLTGKTFSRVLLSTNSCFRLVTYCGVLRYPPVFSPAGKGSCRFWLLTNGLSGWKWTLECCPTHQFSLAGWEEIFDCLTKHHFSFCLGTYCGVLCYPPVLSPDRRRSSRVSLTTTSVFCWKRFLDSCTTQEFSLPPGRFLALSR